MGIIAVRVTTRSSRPGLGEWQVDADGRSYLEMRVAAPPVDGAANKEVIKLLAKALDIPRSSIRIAAGEAARLKRVEVPLDEEEARARL